MGISAVVPNRAAEIEEHKQETVRRLAVCGGPGRAAQLEIRTALLDVWGDEHRSFTSKATTKIEQKHAGRQRRIRSGSRRSDIATRIALIEIAVATAWGHQERPQQAQNIHLRCHASVLSGKREGLRVRAYEAATLCGHAPKSLRSS